MRYVRFPNQIQTRVALNLIVFGNNNIVCTSLFNATLCLNLIGNPNILHRKNCTLHLPLKNNFVCLFLFLYCLFPFKKGKEEIREAIISSLRK